MVDSRGTVKYGIELDVVSDSAQRRPTQVPLSSSALHVYPISPRDRSDRV
jgi:hypothetical protein